MGLWPRYANVHPPKEIRAQVVAYVESDEFISTFNLSTAVRALKSVEPNCLQIIMNTIYSSTNVFSSNRMRLQMAFLVLFSSASAARPGSVVESGCYAKSNEALKWSDVTFYLMPDDEDPNHPSLVIDIRINLVKGHRKNESIYQDLLFTLELGKDERLTCLLIPLLSMALQDGIFQNFHSIGEILCPAHPPQTRITLQLRDDAKDLIICRQVDKKETSRTRAFPYTSFLRYLKKISLAAGFQRM